MKKLLFKNKQSRGLVLLIGFLLISSTALASHFRHGTISWRVVSGNTVEFKISQAWANFGNWSVGQTGYSDRLYFGDGQLQTFAVVATAVNTAENWYYGETTITHTYANIGNFTAYFASCCKIGNLSNNANAGWRNETIVNVGSGNESPVTTMAPIINMQTGVTGATFQVPASDPDGDTLTYRLATSAEINGGQPSGISINPNTGLITFSTQGRSLNSLWNAAIVVEDGQTKVINDFIIKIVQQSNPPIFDYTVTPTNGQIYQVSPGIPVNFSVKADDTDPGATVSLQSIGVPPGANITLSNQNTNSITGNFSWTPTANNLGTNVINFLAQDNFGTQVSTSITILVSLKPQFDVPPTPAQGVHNVYNPGDLISYTVQASDPDPLDVVSITDVKGKNMSGNPISLYANASFSNLNGSPANPTNGTFTWNTQASDWGHKHVYFYATDSYGDVTRHEVSQLINTPPVFTSTPITTADVGTPYSHIINVSDADIAFGDTITILGISIPSWLTLTDNGNGTATLSGVPSVSDVGNTSINIQAEDVNHHQDPRGTINQLFDITVNNCFVNAFAKDITVQLDANGNATISASEINDNSTASCGIASMSIDTTTFNCNNLGSNTVTLTVTDSNGNTETATANVTVEDVTAPTVVTQNISVQLDVNGNASITPNMIDNGSTDNCGIETLELSITDFSCANFGDNQVTLTVTDVNGNTSAGSATVNVSDGTTQTSFNQADYTSIGNSTYLGNSTYRLTTAGNSQFGGVWYQNKLDLSSDFELDFDVYLGTQDYGADGMAFVLQPLNANQGSSGGGLGYQGINPSLAVEFDTYTNYSDPTADHIALTKNGDTNHFTSNNISGPHVVSNLENGAYHNAKVSWNKTTKNFVVVFNGNTIINYTGDIVNDIFSGNNGVYWGFTAATGGLNNEHRVRIKSVEFKENLSITNQSMIAATCSDSLDGSIDISVSQNSPCISYLWSNGATTQDISNLNPGDYTVVISKTDGTSLTETFTVSGDTAAPNAITQNISVDLDANGNASITSEMIDNGSNDTCGIASYTLDITSFSCANVGVNEVVLTVTDNNGNVATATANVTVNDVTPANVITQDISIDLDANGNASITTDMIDNGSTDACGIQSYALDTTSFSCANVGVNEVVLTVTDNNGNVSTATANVTVIDVTQANVITQDISIDLDTNGNASITTDMIDNGSSDSCGIQSYSLDITSFSCANLGVNEVVLTVTDNNGNISSATANVTVNDVTPANVVTQDISINLDANGNASITTDMIDNGSFDNCAIASFALDNDTFSCTNVGNNQVTLTVTDVHNNVSSATANVTVVDNILPTVITQDISVNLDENGSVSITTDMIDNGSFDNCAISSFSLDNDTFSCTNVGNNQVTLTVTDVNGNVSSATANVVVNDVTSPTVITQTATVTLANGEASISTFDVDGGTFDNCSFTLSLDNNMFTCSDIGENTVTLTATDASGNTSSQTATVNVVGDIPTVSINDFNAVQTQKKNTIFLGFGPSSINLSTVVSGGSGFTYEWTASTGESVSSEANPSVSPVVSTTYNVVVTNSNGCTASTSLYVCVIDARAFDKKGRYKGKVIVCHHTSGKKGTKHVEIEISANAVMTHLTKHGVGTDHADSLGACNATCVGSSSGKGYDYTKTSFTASISDNLNVYPNPSQGIFDIRLTGISLETNIMLFDINGKLLERKMISAENSEQNIITIGNYNLSSGVYLLKIVNQNESITKKLLVTKD